MKQNAKAGMMYKTNEQTNKTFKKINHNTQKKIISEKNLHSHKLMKQKAKAGMMYKTNKQTQTHFDVNQGFENHKFLQPLIKTPPLLTY